MLLGYSVNSVSTLTGARYSYAHERYEDDARGPLLLWESWGKVSRIESVTERSVDPVLPLDSLGNLTVRLVGVRVGSRVV